MSAKSQVVIPQSVREKLKLKPKTKLIFYGEVDTIIMKKVQLPDSKKEWERIEEIIEERNRNHGLLTDENVKREVEAYRREKQKMKRQS